MTSEIPQSTRDKLSDKDIPEAFWSELSNYEPAEWRKLSEQDRQAVTDTVLSRLERYFTDTDAPWYFSTYKNEVINGHDYAIRKAWELATLTKWSEAINASNRRKNEIRRGVKLKCGAKRKNGKACKAPIESGRNRCRFHGGRSTGPTTIEGRIKALANLPQYRDNPEALNAKRREIEAGV